MVETEYHLRELCLPRRGAWLAGQRLKNRVKLIGRGGASGVVESTVAYHTRQAFSVTMGWSALQANAF
jgi:hypothetical protein